MVVAVAGGSGFVGRALTRRLVAAGHEVVALSRSGVAEAGARAMAVDIGDKAAAIRTLAEADAAFYLVHSMAAGPGFREIDRQLAATFGRAAADAGVGRIVYLGGLGDGPTSEHLASRQEVGPALGAAGVPVVELRAAVVLGAGSISFEMLRYLTERLPLMVCPRWVRTRIQPIGLDDLTALLEEALAVEPGVYEVGGSDVTTYRDLIAEYARVRGLRRRVILDVPALTPHLSSYWVDLVTPVDRAVSHALIESLVTEVVVSDPLPARAAFSVVPAGTARAIRTALDQQAEHIAHSLLDRRAGLEDGVYCVVVEVDVPDGAGEALARDLGRIGGSRAWYGAAWGWALRTALGRLVDEHLRLRRGVVAEGELVDWWRVVRAEPGELILAGVGWKPGDAWLGYRVTPGRLRQVAALRPKGGPGLLYWKLLQPVHRVAFAVMARHRIRRAATRVASP